MSTKVLRRKLIAILPLLGLAGLAVAAPEQLRVSTRTYPTPNIGLIREDGKPVSMVDEMNDGRPVVLNFIFTDCGAICPLMTQTFAEFQRKLGSESSRLHLMSISIDPEEDTPPRLREYMQRFRVGPGWNFYTGTEAASVMAQKAFNLYRGDKMSHTAVTLIRPSPTASWRRIDGLATPDELVREFHAALAEPAIAAQ